MATSLLMSLNVSERPISLTHNRWNNYPTRKPTHWVFWECQTSLMLSRFLNTWQRSSKSTVKWPLWGGFPSIKKLKPDSGTCITRLVKSSTSQTANNCKLNGMVFNQKPNPIQRWHKSCTQFTWPMRQTSSKVLKTVIIWLTRLKSWPLRLRVAIILI